MAELKPCPFCGRMPISFEHNVETTNTGIRHYMEVKCSCRMNFTKSWEEVHTVRLGEVRTIKLDGNEAIDKWNTRVTTESEAEKK